MEAARARGMRTLSLSRSSCEGRPDELFADMTDTAAVRTALTDLRLDTVVHLAATVHRDGSVATSARIDDSLEAVVRATTPRSVILASSAAVYGDGLRGPRSERSPTLGETPYARAKLASEQRLRALAAELPALAVTVLRIFNIAGPNFPDSLVNRLLVAHPAHPARLVRPDSFVRDYVHQADVVRVVMDAIAHKQPGYQIFNVGAGVPVTSRQLLDTLQVQDDAWVEVDGDASECWADNTALVRRFGLSPLAVPTRAWRLPTPE